MREPTHARRREWSPEPPEVSGIYLFFDHLDALAEDISTLEVDVDRNEVLPAYKLGESPAPLDRFRGVWFGPLATPPPRG